MFFFGWNKRWSSKENINNLETLNGKTDIDGGNDNMPIWFEHHRQIQKVVPVPADPTATIANMNAEMMEQQQQKTYMRSRSYQIINYFSLFCILNSTIQ